MGKYAATRVVYNHNNSGRNNFTLTENGFADWLYADDWSKSKLTQYSINGMIPGLNQYQNFLLDLRSDQEYLSRYGMTYSDIHDPRKLRQSGSFTSLGSSVLDVSKNVAFLYK